MKRILVVGVVLVLASCNTPVGPAPTAPTPVVTTPPPAPTPAPTPPPPVVQRFTVAGVVSDASTGRPIGGATVSTQSAPNASTDGNGYYSMAGVLAGIVSLGIVAPGYNGTIDSQFTVSGDTRRDHRLVAFWKANGVGNTVFDMPRTVTRVRIIGVLTGGLSNFIVRIGGRLTVNEIIGNRPGYSMRTEGVYLTTGGVVEITNSSGVEWTFIQEQ